MSANMTPPTTDPSAVAGGAALGGQTGVTAPGTAPVPREPMPWDDQQRQLDAMKTNLANLDAVRRQAAGAWDAVKDAPVDDRGVYAAPGTVTSQDRANALDAYTSSEQAYARALSDMGALSTDIAAAKQKYQDSQDKLNPTPEAKARVAADTAAANAQATYYRAQATEAQARADYLTSPEGKGKDKAAAKLDNARADTEKAQQAYYGTQQVYLGAQTAEANANAALTGARATAYPTESAAAVAANTAQAASSTAEAAVHEEELRKSRLGELGAFIDSLATAQKAGLITQAEAERLVAAKEQEALTGATAFDRQKQADANMTTLVNGALQSGNAVRPDQQYVVGGNPGGDIQRMLGGLGIQYTPAPLQPATMPSYAASLGLAAPAGVAAANGAPAYAQGLMGPPAVEDWSGHDLRALHATLTGSAPQPAAPPAAPPPAAPPGATLGGVNNGLLLSAPITGAPNYARLPGT